MLACVDIEDHSKSEGRCFGGFTPSFSAASEIDLEEDMATGMSFLWESRFASVMNKPDHSTQRASEVVHDDLSSCAADTSMSSLLSKSPDESATPIFANSKVAFWKTCSKSPISGQCGSDNAPISSMIASGKRSERVETSGRFLPP